VTREAYAEAFRKVTGRPLVQLPQMAGRSESGIFFEALALNGIDMSDVGSSEGLLPLFNDELATSFAARRDLLPQLGRLLPGARESVAAVGRLRDVVQTVFTGSIKPNAVQKLRAFGLEQFFDFGIGGYGSEAYPRGTLLRVARSRAAEKYGVPYGEDATVYIGDSTRDVEAARIGGARSIGVASGRSTLAELREAGADLVLADLSNASSVVRAVERLTQPGAGS
jgi:phosphoglycolate phosphatase-like HAD superfamily hydrolase